MAFATAEVENLMKMLSANGPPRPSDETTGYSKEDVGGDAPPPADATATNAPRGAASGIHVPSTVIDNQIGLPTPSLTKQGKEMLETAQKAQRTKVTGNDIWAQDEVSHLPTPAPTASSQQSKAGRSKEPSYTIAYKQHRSAEDVYLGVDFTRLDTTGLCDEIVVKFELPDIANVAQVSKLEAEPSKLVLEGGPYAVTVSLPLKVLAKRAAAKWDSSSRKLNVTLTVDKSDRMVKVV